MEDGGVAVSDDTRNRIAEAVRCALQTGVPYMLAKDLHHDYPDVKFEVLLSIIKDLVVEASAKSNQSSCKRTSTTPCVLIRHQDRRNTAGRLDVDVELKSFIRLDAHPFQWTEKDVDYERLEQYLMSDLRFRDSADMFRYYTSGGRHGYLENTMGLTRLLGELLAARNPQDLVVFLRVEKGAYHEALEKAGYHPPDVAEWYAQMLEARNDQRS